MRTGPLMGFAACLESTRRYGCASRYLSHSESSQLPSCIETRRESASGRPHRTGMERERPSGRVEMGDVARSRLLPGGHTCDYSLSECSLGLRCTTMRASGSITFLANPGLLEARSESRSNL